MPPVTFAQTRRSFGAKPTTGQTQGSAGMGGPPPQQQQLQIQQMLKLSTTQSLSQMWEE